MGAHRECSQHAGFYNNSHPSTAITKLPGATANKRTAAAEVLLDLALPVVDPLPDADVFRDSEVFLGPDELAVPDPDALVVLVCEAPEEAWLLAEETLEDAAEEAEEVSEEAEACAEDGAEDPDLDAPEEAEADLPPDLVVAAAEEAAEEADADAEDAEDAATAADEEAAAAADEEAAAADAAASLQCFTGSPLKGKKHGAPWHAPTAALQTDEHSPRVEITEQSPQDICAWAVDAIPARATMVMNLMLTAV